MTEKRFIPILDKVYPVRITGIIDKSNNEKLTVFDEVVDKLNLLSDENEQLKKALLFFVDVANCECSSGWDKDMEKCCQKLFNCSYDEAKEKYGDFDALWWELSGLND